MQLCGQSGGGHLLPINQGAAPADRRRRLRGRYVNLYFPIGSGSCLVIKQHVVGGVQINCE